MRSNDVVTREDPGDAVANNNDAATHGTSFECVLRTKTFRIPPILPPIEEDATIDKHNNNDNIRHKPLPLCSDFVAPIVGELLVQLSNKVLSNTHVDDNGDDKVRWINFEQDDDAYDAYYI